MSNQGSSDPCGKRKLNLSANELRAHPIYNLQLWTMDGGPIRAVPIPAGREN